MKQFKQLLSILLVTAMVCTGDISTAFGATKTVVVNAGVTEASEAAENFVETEDAKVGEGTKEADVAEVTEDAQVSEKTEVTQAAEADDSTEAVKDAEGAKSTEATEDVKVKEDSEVVDDEEDETADSVRDIEIVDTDSVSADKDVSAKTSRAKTEGIPVSDEEAEEIIARLSVGTIEGPNDRLFDSYDVSEDDSIESVLPEKFNPLDKSTEAERNRTLPSTRDQGSWGTCWAFSTIGLAEIETQTSERLSEYHLAYFTYNSATDQDPLGNLDGENGNVPTDKYNNIYMEDGGNNLFAANVLASWTGAANSKIAPYPAYQKEQLSGIPENEAFNDEVHLENYYKVNPSTDRVGTKDLIYKYGAVGILYYCDDYVETVNGQRMVFRPSYNSEYNSWYCPEKLGTNHVVSIVGWDDNFSRWHFNDVPEGNGAWLVRNSWSDKSEYSEYAYFWMSYYDKSLCELGVAMDFEDASNYDNNYQYDGGMVSSGTSDFKAANVFTATGSQKLEAVSFAANCAGAPYTIEVYTGITDDNNPESGTLSATENGTTTYAGYYTIPLKNAVSLTEDQKFSIVVSVNPTKKEDYNGLVVEYTWNGWARSTTYCKPGQSFWLNEKDNKWYDLSEDCDGEYGNYKIKAFTNNDSAAEDYTGKVNVYVNGEKNETIKIDLLERNSDGNYVKYNEGKADADKTFNTFNKGKNIAMMLPEGQFGDDPAWHATKVELQRTGSETKRELDYYSVNVVEGESTKAYDKIFLIPASDTAGDINIYFTTKKFGKVYVYEKCGTGSVTLSNTIKLTCYPHISNEVFDKGGAYENYYIPGEYYLITTELKEKNVDCLYYRKHGDSDWIEWYNPQNLYSVKDRGQVSKLLGYALPLNEDDMDIRLDTSRYSGTLDIACYLSNDTDNDNKYLIRRVNSVSYYDSNGDCKATGNSNGDEERDHTLRIENTGECDGYFVFDFDVADGYSIKGSLIVGEEYDQVNIYERLSANELISPYYEEGSDLPSPNKLVLRLPDIQRENNKVGMDFGVEKLSQTVTAKNDIIPAYYKTRDKADWIPYPTDDASGKSIKVDKYKTVQLAYEYVEEATDNQVVAVKFSNTSDSEQSTIVQFPASDAITIVDKKYTIFEYKVTDNIDFAAAALPSLDAISPKNVTNDVSEDFDVRYSGVTKWRGRYYPLSATNPTVTIDIISKSGEKTVVPNIMIKNKADSGLPAITELKEVYAIKERGRLVYKYSFNKENKDYNYDTLRNSAEIVIRHKKKIISINIDKLSAQQKLSVEFNKTSTFNVRVNDGADVKNIFLLDAEGKKCTEYTDQNVGLSVNNGVLTVNTRSGKIASEGTNVSVTLVGGIYYSNENGEKTFYESYRKTIDVVVGSPSWKKAKPSVSISGSTDKSFIFKLSTPNGVDFNTSEEDDTGYYYKISVTPVNAAEPELKAEDNLVAYVPVSLNSYEMDVLTCDRGKGHQAKFNVNVQFVLADKASRSGTFTEGDRDEGEATYMTSAATLLKNITTKQPYYADSIKLKGVKTNLYAGESGIKVATVDFGNKASYVSREDWRVNDLPAGFSVDGTKADGNNDNGVYLSVAPNTAPGTYEIKVSTKTANDASDNPITAVIKVKVLETIGSIDISGPAKVYRKNLNTAVKVTPTKVIKDEQGNVIKKPLLSYKLYYRNGSDWVEVNDKKLATIDNNGTVSVAKGCTFTKYKVVASAADFADHNVPDSNPAEDVDSRSYEFEITEAKAVLKSVAAYETSAFDSETKVLQSDAMPIKAAIPYDKLKDFVWVVSVQCIEGGEPVDHVEVFNGLDGSLNTVLTATDSLFGDFMYTVSVTPNVMDKAPTKAGTITCTVKTIDGASKKASASYTYQTGQEEYADVALYTKGASNPSSYNIVDVVDRKNKKTGERNEYVISGPSSQIIEVWLTDKSYVVDPEASVDISERTNNRTATVTKGGEVVLVKAGDTIPDFVEGSISVSNAKVILNENNQHLQFYITKSPATLTVSKKDGRKTVKKTYSLISESLRDLAAAPSGKLLSAGDDGKLYTNYDYYDENNEGNEGEKLVVLLGDDVLNYAPGADTFAEGLSDEEIQAEQTDREGRVFVRVVADQSSKELTDCFVLAGSGSPSYGTTEIIVKKKPKTVGTVTFTFGPVKLAKAGNYKLAFEYVYTDNDVEYVLTKAPTVVTIKAENFKKNAVVKSAYTLSATDCAEVELGLSKNVGVSGFSAESIRNSNEKGTYSDFCRIFKLDTANKKLCLRSLDDYVLVNTQGVGEDEIAQKAFEYSELLKKYTGKKINGYIEYKISYADGTEETRFVKTTVTLAKNTKKWTQGNAVSITLAAIASSAEPQLEVVSVKAGNEISEVGKIGLGSDKYNKMIDSLYVNDDGKLVVVLKKDEGANNKKGTFSIVVNIVPKGSIYDEIMSVENGSVEVESYNSIPVTIKYTITPN